MARVMLSTGVVVDTRESRSLIARLLRDEAHFTLRSRQGNAAVLIVSAHVAAIWPHADDDDWDADVAPAEFARRVAVSNGSP